MYSWVTLVIIGFILLVVGLVILNVDFNINGENLIDILGIIVCAIGIILIVIGVIMLIAQYVPQK